MKTKTQIKKLAVWLFSLVMLMALVPSFTLAAEAAEKNITLGTSALKGKQQSSVYFGSYQQSSLGNTEPTDGTEGIDWIKSTTAVNNSQGPYYKKDPIKWRVLDVTDEKAFLLSDKNLDVVQYHTEYENVTWETSTIRSWLNGYGATSNQNSVDYSDDNFINAAFGAAEKGVIADTTVVNNDNPLHDIPGGNNTTDKVFLLSIAEAKTVAYGFIINDIRTDKRISTNTAYVYGGGKIGTSTMDAVGRGGYWWLRSPGKYHTNGAAVGAYGNVEINGYIENYTGFTIRPAFNLNLSSVLFTSAAKGGKPSTAAAGDGAEILKNADLSTLTGSDGYKLTILDGNRNFAVSDTAEKTVNPSDTISLKYTGATTGTNEYISAMIADENGEVIYYGQLAQSTAESGTVEFTVPSDIEAGTYTIKVFNEQINDDYKTDYASDFVNINIHIHKYENGICQGCGTYESATDENSDGVYEIANAGQLLWFAEKVNAGDTAIDGKLMGDIDLTDVTYTPIGSESKPYIGTFDGKGYSIKNMVINSTAEYQGLFGMVDAGAVIKNVVIDKSCSVSGGDFTAAIAGGSKRNASGKVTIENCINYANVSGGKHAGGIFGGNTGADATVIIGNCANMGNITGTSLSGAIAGYLGNGDAVGTIEKCWNTGTLTCPDRGDSFAHLDAATIINCYNLETLSASAKDGVSTFTEEELANGALAYKLGEHWGQTIGTDNYPILGGEKVYSSNEFYHNEVKEFEILSNGTDGATAAVAIPTAGTYTLIFADYEETRLNKVDSVTVTAESDNTVITVPSEIDITLGTGDKVMLWQDMTGIKPLCEEYIVG